MRLTGRFTFLWLIIVLLVGAVLWVWWGRSRLELAGLGSTRKAPVAVGPVETGVIELTRNFSGTMDAYASFVVAPKVGGRIARLGVDLGDIVQRGQIVAELDDAEFFQEVAQAEADLAVARANLTEAQSLWEIANREIERFNALRERGFTSEAQYDTAHAEQLAREAQLAVARAQVTRAESALAAARIRLGYTTVVAEWQGGSDTRVVANRQVDEGETVSANAGLVQIVELERMVAVIHVTERDYGSIVPGQFAEISTDAFPGETFEGSVARIAPVFREATRQARVEIVVPNPDHRLKPGMFVRASLTLEHHEDATIVPEVALTRRGGRDGIFLVDPEGERVRWAPVTIGVRHGGRVAVEGEGIEGRVVVLGQQLVDDGSEITIPEETKRAQP